MNHEHLFPILGLGHVLDCMNLCAHKSCAIFIVLCTSVSIITHNSPCLHDNVLIGIDCTLAKQKVYISIYTRIFTNPNYHVNVNIALWVSIFLLHLFYREYTYLVTQPSLTYIKEKSAVRQFDVINVTRLLSLLTKRTDAIEEEN